MAYSPSDFGPGTSGDQIVWLRERLAAHGFPSVTRWTEDDRTAVQQLQLAQGWKGTQLGGGADGYPGPKTLAKLTSDPTPAPHPDVFPSQVINLTNWKITLPTGEEDHPTEVLQPALASYEDVNFYASDAGDYVIFRVTGNGVTTSGSSYPRCELREMDYPDRASWSTLDDRYLFEAEYAVRSNAKVVVAQIHDAEDDLVMVSLEGTRLVAEYSYGKGLGSEKVPIGEVQQGQWFRIAISAANGVVSVSLNGVVRVTRNKSRSGCYGKAGAYLQSADSSAWAEVWMKKDSLKMSHV